MKNKIWWGILIYLISNLLFAAGSPAGSVSAKDAVKEQRKDLMQWSYTRSQKGDDVQLSADSTVLSDPNGCFEQNSKATDLNIRNVKDLEPLVEEYETRKTIFLLGHRLYGISPEGEPATADPDEEFLRFHGEVFCFPQSIESEAFPKCKKTTPMVLQFGDVRLPSIKNKYSDAEISLIENLIKNLFTPQMASSQIIYKLNSLSNKEVRDEFIRKLKSLRILSFAANSINHIYAEGIPRDRKDPNSPSIASSRAEEVDNRHYNPNWHEAVNQTNSPMELFRQLVLISANSSAQLQTIIEQQQRIELLLAGMAIDSANKDELMTEILRSVKKK